MYRDTGTVWVQIAETGASDTDTLQTVTDRGNTTDNTLILTYDSTFNGSNAIEFFDVGTTATRYSITKQGTGNRLTIQGNSPLSTNDMGIMIDALQNTLRTYWGSSFNSRGFSCDFTNNIYRLGNVSGTVGEQGIYINATGQVGIGTTSPSNELHVVTGNVDGIRVESSGSGYLETGKTGGARYRWANDYTSLNMLELQYGAAGATPTTNRMSVFSNGNIAIGTNIDQGYGFYVNGTTTIGGTELRLNNATTGTINLYSATPIINFFSSGGYTFGRSSTVMTWNSGGSISMQIGGNNAYSLDATNGHVWRTATSGGAALARLDTGGSLSIGNAANAANASSILDLTSTTKGFLLPRMTTTQVNAIATPANGLLVYNTTIDHFCGYQAGAWVRFSHSPM
jgi:hypothetical protein